MSTQWIKLAIRTLRWLNEEEATDKADWAEQELKQLEARPLPMDIEQLRAENAALRQRVSELESGLQPFAEFWKEYQDDEWPPQKALVRTKLLKQPAALLEQKP